MKTEKKSIADYDKEYEERKQIALNKIQAKKAEKSESQQQFEEAKKVIQEKEKKDKKIDEKKQQMKDLFSSVDNIQV